MSAEHRRAGVVLRLVKAGPNDPPSQRPPTPALDAALAAARDALSASTMRGALAVSQHLTLAVALLGQAWRTRSRGDVLSLASALAALSVEGVDDARGLAGDPSGAWSDRADDASHLARAAAVLLASLPRGAS